MADNIWTATVEGIAARGRANNGSEGDYRDEEGFLCCGKCRTRKEGDITIGEKTLRVPHLCKCESEASRQREAEEKAAEFRKQCERLRKDGITDPSYLSQNFTQDDNRNARISDVCRRYVEHWPEMKADNSLCDNVLEPYLSKTFIYDNYASQKGKGTHFGLDRLKYFMSRYYRQNGADGWVLKCDIRKYFYSINHDVLKEQLRRLIKDRDVLWLLDMIIDSTKGPGIPIGNHTSQWFAVLYLSGMDHMIKERLGIKMYGRYMDDFYLIHPDKDYLRYCLEEIKKYLVPLGLELNQKTAIFPLTQGIDFLGFRTYLTDTGKVVRKVRRESKNRIRRKLKKYRHLLDEGRIDFETILQSYSSWTGHAEHGNSYHLIRKTDDLFFNLFKNELEGLTYGKITIRFARWKRCQVDEHEIQRESDQVDRGNPGHSQRPNGPGDRENDHTEMLRREGAFEHER